MDIAVEDKIRQRAYEIWMSAGTSARDPATDWLEAERAVMNETVKSLVKSAAANHAAKPSKITSMADMASGEPITKAAKKAQSAKATTKTKAPTASAAKPATVRKRTNIQA